ncbi:MAG: hypothetical protein U5K76_15440 [Woeseiaceae bacterium]|nr:hypothetical protein [Woeseiaceae bacterium]
MLSTMGRGFWLLDNITTLRQRSFDSRGDRVLLFAPKETYRYRSSGDDDTGVPEYPRPAAVIDYFLPADDAGAIRLDIVAPDGSLVNSYQGKADGVEGDGDATSGRDMATEEIRHVVDETLTREPGMNRFRWDMTHRGAWHAKDDERFRDGPVAAPGDYTLRLTVGDTTVEQPVTLRTDPRVLEYGTTLADIRSQVDLLLDIRDLLNDARKLANDLENEKQTLEEKRDEGPLSEAETSRLVLVEKALDALQTKEGIYRQPMLIAQIDYLYGMLDDADQVPGGEARERFDVLRGQLRQVSAALETGGG